MIIYAPIEPLPERYSVDWHNSFVRAFSQLSSDVVVVGDRRIQSIEHGQFLDAYNTGAYKARQLAETIEIISKTDEDVVVFLMDAWFPGIESLAYIRNVAQRKITIKGMLHAGCYDHNDHLNRTGCSSWGIDLERSWLNIYDELFVATEYHRDLIAATHGPLPCRVSVVPFLVRGVTERVCWDEKDDVVVFPHRLAPEKQPQVFDLVRELYEESYGEGVRWIRTKDLWDQHDPVGSKERYFEYLKSAKVAFSSALQETFGIAMLEAAGSWAWPVAPDSLSYKETLAEYPRYTNLRHAVELIHSAIVSDPWTKKRPSDRYESDAAARVIVSML